MTKAAKKGADCGKVLYSLQVVGGSEVPAWAKLDTATQMIVVNLSKETKPFFSTRLVLTAQLSDYPNAVAAIPFSVSLGTAGFSCLTISPATFMVGDPVMQFGVMYANNTAMPDDIKLTQVIEPVVINENNQEVSLPGFLTYKSMQFTIANPPFESVGKYQIGLKMGYQEFPQSIVSCLKKVDVKYVTKFNGVIPKIIFISSD